MRRPRSTRSVAHLFCSGGQYRRDVDRKAVLLDAGGVLIVPDIARLVSALVVLGHQPVDCDPARVHFEAVAAMDHDPHQLEPTTAYWQALMDLLGIELTPPVTEAVLQLARDPDYWAVPVGDVHRHLKAIADAFPVVGVVSNSDGTIEQVLRDARICQVGTGPGVEVDVIIDSTVHGVAKPDPAVFGMALDAVGVQPSETIYVGDSVRLDVQSANAAGIHPVHCDPYHLCPIDGHDHVAGLVGLLNGDRPEAG